jgi:hypothetical protein
LLPELQKKVAGRHHRAVETGSKFHVFHFFTGSPSPFILSVPQFLLLQTLEMRMK